MTQRLNSKNLTCKDSDKSVNWNESGSLRTLWSRAPPKLLQEREITSILFKSLLLVQE